MADGSIGSVWTVYKATSKTSKKSYIGITGQTIYRRWLMHVADARNEKYRSLLHRAIRLYSPDDFVVETISTAPDRKAAGVLEKLFIESFETFAPNGYNLTKGGDGGATITGQKRTPETCAKISLGLTGRTIDPKVVERVAEKLRGRKQSTEHIEARRWGLIKPRAKKTEATKVTDRRRRREEAMKRTPSVSGAVGCSISGPNFRARIHINGKDKNLGSFKTLDEAKAAYEAAAKAHLTELQRISH